jgi:hypothetical protein
MRKSLLLVLAFALSFALLATAQNNCLAVRGIAQEHLLDFGNPDWQGGEDGAPWVGPVQLILGDQKILVGKVSENDGEKKPTLPQKQATVHQSEGGHFFFDFTKDGYGTFVVQTDNSVYPFLPKFKDVAGTGTFHGQGPVDTNMGTGRFANATGNFTIKGDFLAWDLEAKPPSAPSARFNVTITGFLCNVTP